MLEQLFEQAERDGVTVVHRVLSEATGGGVCAWITGDPVVYLDPRLPRPERAAVLAHELAHARRGRLPRPGPPADFGPLVVREERACDWEAARMLVDLGWLADVMAMAEADGVTVTPVDVAADAEVTVSVAELAMQMVLDGHEVGGRRVA